MGRTRARPRLSTVEEGPRLRRACPSQREQYRTHPKRGARHAASSEGLMVGGVARVTAIATRPQRFTKIKRSPNKCRQSTRTLDTHLLDIALAVLLIFVVPLIGVWRSRRADDTSASRSARYWRAMATIGALLTVLATSWTMSGRDMNELGLGVPTSSAALAGLAIATLLLAVLRFVVRAKRTFPEDAAETPASALLPRRQGEMALFVLFAIAVGFGWEGLYRGFLFGSLVAYVDVAGAII